MNRQPDVIRALVVVFTVGLLISGLTTLAASEGGRSASTAQVSGLMVIADETTRSN